MSEQHVCVNKDEIERLKKQVETLRESNMEQREDMVEFRMDMKYTKETLGEIKNIVKALADEPKKSWESVKKQSLTFVVSGGLIGFVLWAIIMGTGMLDKAN